MTEFLLLVGIWLHATNCLHTWQMWQILKHVVLELFWSHLSPTVLQKLIEFENHSERFLQLLIKMFPLTLKRNIAH